MSTYKCFDLKGKLRYMKDGKFVKVADLPKGLEELMQPGKEYTEADARPELPIRQCFIDGQGARMCRMVEGQTVYLCDEHYYDLSIGKIAARLKELNYI